MKIGDFSQITNVPVKTLRYYSDIGLLKPQKVNESHYRYYGVLQLSQLNQILSLKETGFTLREITLIIKDKLTDDNLLRVLESKMQETTKEKVFVESKTANIQRRIQHLKESKEQKMILENLSVPPFQSTLMGVIKGVCDYYGYKLSDAMICGGSGQAFLMNIHEQLCPSGPYCWNHTPFYALLKNLGIQMTDFGLITEDSTLEERTLLENKVKQHLINKHPCATHKFWCFKENFSVPT